MNELSMQILAFIRDAKKKINSDEITQNFLTISHDQIIESIEMLAAIKYILKHGYKRSGRPVYDGISILPSGIEFLESRNR